MDKMDLELRISRLEDALAIAIAALEELTKPREADTELYWTKGKGPTREMLDYLERVLQDTALDDWG